MKARGALCAVKQCKVGGQLGTDRGEDRQIELRTWGERNPQILQQLEPALGLRWGDAVGYEANSQPELGYRWHSCGHGHPQCPVWDLCVLGLHVHFIKCLLCARYC